MKRDPAASEILDQLSDEDDRWGELLTQWERESVNEFLTSELYREYEVTHEASHEPTFERRPDDAPKGRAVARQVPSSF